jgi:hypothetical protein
MSRFALFRPVGQPLSFPCRRPRLLVRLPRPRKSLPRVFQSLLGMLVPAQMITLPMTGRGSPMRVRSLFVKFCSPLVRIVWHRLSILNSNSNLPPYAGARCPPFCRRRSWAFCLCLEGVDLDLTTDPRNPLEFLSYII